ncbi:MAG: RNA polymerase sigma factor [Bacteroidales bacterium]|nr:RNA polymerase sigma factor [Bacteroidales bacterium]
MKRPLHKTSTKHTAYSDEELNELYAMLMHEALKATSQLHVAQDMVQECLTLTLEQVYWGKGIEHFKAYCFKVLHSLKIRLWNDQNRIRHVDSMQEESLVDDIDYYTTEMALKECLSRLSQREREIVELHDLECHSLEETAAKMGLTISYATRLLGRAHTALKKELKEYYYGEQKN